MFLHTNKGFWGYFTHFVCFCLQIYCMLKLSSIFQIKTCGFHLPTKGGVGGRAIPAALAVS